MVKILSLNELVKYKDLNKGMLPEVQNFYNLYKHKFNNSKRRHKPDMYENDDEQLYSQVRSILNKLSIQNFDQLLLEFNNLKISKCENLEKISELIFNKAILETKFTPIYAKLSKSIGGFYVDDGSKITYLKELLVCKCQKMFNDCLQDEKMASIGTGCLKFIGELYNYEILSGKIINNCFLLLLKNKNNSNIIDFICILMKTVGKIFTKKCIRESEDIFKRLDQILKSGLLPNKERFGLMDLFDIKNMDKW
jgi:translation initiation factor 4G